MSEFKSALAPYMKGLIAQKRALGFKYYEQESQLLKFDSMLQERYPQADTITKEIAEYWAIRKPYEKATTVRHRMTPITHLALHMNKLGCNSFVFRLNELGKEEKYQAQIYSDDELDRFFRAVDTCCHYSSEVPYRQFVMPLLFRMIYCCGLRPGEAISLRVCDVDIQNGTLKILASKYDSDRLVPMSDSLWNMCRTYYQTVHNGSSNDMPFFPGYQGKPITLDNLSHNFRRFLYYAGISHGGRGKGPRIYDFRHTFAVNCLRNLVMSDKSMNAYYPILKTYMGHSFFKYTAYYLKLTRNMFPDISEKLSLVLGDIIPEIGGDNCE